MGVKLSEIYHKIQIYWFGAQPFSLGGARIKNHAKPVKRQQKMPFLQGFFILAPPRLDG